MHLISLWLEFRGSKVVAIVLVHSLSSLASEAALGSYWDVTLIPWLRECCQPPCPALRRQHRQLCLTVGSEDGKRGKVSPEAGKHKSLGAQEGTL